MVTTCSGYGTFREHFILTSQPKTIAHCLKHNTMKKPNSSFLF